MKYIDLLDFKEYPGLLDGTSWFIVVKSQDQIDRRNRLIKTWKKGRFGRISARVPSAGLLLKGTFEHNTFNIIWQRIFKEPRHIVQLAKNRYLLTEINQLLLLDENGNVLRRYENSFFSFLHTVDISPDSKRALVVASGYDAIFEINLSDHRESFSWFSWDHGFNPDSDGTWLTSNKETFKRYQDTGKPCLLINPSDYGEAGIATALRSAHPNAARYNPYDNYSSIIVSIGHEGQIYRVQLANGETTLVTDCLGQMPHGILPWESGWAITNTTAGQWYLFDSNFNHLQTVSAAELPGKVSGTENVEWIQQIIPLNASTLLFLDANRGIYAVDLNKKCLSKYSIDENFALQDAMITN